MEKYELAKHTMAYGTSLCTYVEAGYKQLVGLFGEPNAQGDDYKVSTMWILRDKKGKTMTLYDYKETNLYDRGLPSVEQFRRRKKYQWHIGAKHLEEANELKQFIEESLQK